MSTTTDGVDFDGWACERVGTVVYSVTVDQAGVVLRGPWAICDHCGALDTTISYVVGPDGCWIDRSDLEPHECPPPGAPLPARSVCAKRPCAACTTQSPPALADEID